MQTGVVLWFSPRLGYGFIKSDDGEEIFFHFSQIVKEGFKTIRSKERVRFIPDTTKEKKEATHVESIASEEDVTHEKNA